MKLTGVKTWDLDAIRCCISSIFLENFGLIINEHSMHNAAENRPVEKNTWSYSIKAVIVNIFRHTNSQVNKNEPAEPATENASPYA